MRFDPIEHFGCYCKIKNLKANINNISIQSINAFESLADGSDRFINCDPQYKILGDFSGITFLSIEYDIEIISPEEVVELLLEEHINILKCANLELSQEVEALSKQNNLLNEKNTELDNLCNLKDNELKMIYSSRSYRLIKKYYNMRDFLLRRIVKSSATLRVKRLQ